VAEITAAGGTAQANADDVSAWSGAEAAVTEAVGSGGHLDVLVNNAGILRDAMSFSMDEAQWADVVRDVEELVETEISVGGKGYVIRSEARGVASFAAGRPGMRVLFLQNLQRTIELLPSNSSGAPQEGQFKVTGFWSAMVPPGDWKCRINPLSPISA